MVVRRRASSRACHSMACGIRRATRCIFSMSGLSTDLLSPDSFYSSGPPTGGRHTCCSRLRERLRTLPCWPIVALLVVFCGLVLCVTSLFAVSRRLRALSFASLRAFRRTVGFRGERSCHSLHPPVRRAAPDGGAHRLLQVHHALGHRLLRAPVPIFCGGHGGAKCAGQSSHTCTKCSSPPLRGCTSCSASRPSRSWACCSSFGMRSLSRSTRYSLALDTVHRSIDAQCLVGKNGTCAVEAVHLTANYVEENWLGGCDNIPAAAAVGRKLSGHCLPARAAIGDLSVRLL